MSRAQRYNKDRMFLMLRNCFIRTLSFDCLFCVFSCENGCAILIQLNVFLCYSSFFLPECGWVGGGKSIQLVNLPGSIGRPSTPDISDSATHCLNNSD